MSQHIVYSINLQNIDTFTYQKALLQTLLLLLFKIVESLQSILKRKTKHSQFTFLHFNNTNLNKSKNQWCRFVIRNLCYHFLVFSLNEEELREEPRDELRELVLFSLKNMKVKPQKKPVQCLVCFRMKKQTITSKRDSNLSGKV